MPFVGWPLADICEHFWRILHVPLDADGWKGTLAIRHGGKFPMMVKMTSFGRIWTQFGRVWKAPSSSGRASWACCECESSHVLALLFGCLSERGRVVERSVGWSEVFAFCMLLDYLVDYQLAPSSAHLDRNNWCFVLTPEFASVILRLRLSRGACGCWGATYGMRIVNGVLILMKWDN